MDGNGLAPNNADNPASNACPPEIVNPIPGVSFIVRPFPPPTLVGVPIEFVVAQLRKIAVHFWGKQETGDCTIIIPMTVDHKYRSRRTSDGGFPSRRSLSDQANSGVPFTTITDEMSVGRRGSAPIVGEGQRKRMILKLHRDYLCSQSSFFRSVFSGVDPLDPKDPKNPRPTSKLAAGAFNVPLSSQPRLLPCTMNHPQLYLPLPDPGSFPHLAHYLYFGSLDYLEDLLHRGDISWEGVVRNVEYLGLRDEVKVFLGRWWSQWLDPTRQRTARGPGLQPSIDEEESEGDEAGDEAGSEPDVPPPRRSGRIGMRNGGASS